ncbi:MAG TPA: biotin--[acetyl-CoA-carboxylase] ligase [Solirubrobacteraceae bacterium]|nr:biotin--[acetyl-CoA-carboxylase] ligase [Solirubrobacteraceae bacterium]
MSAPPLGHPRLHLGLTDSTNERARDLAVSGAPHGTVVTANKQSAGRGRQGRRWLASPGDAVLCSVVVRQPPRLLPLASGVAVAQAAEEALSRHTGLDTTSTPRCLLKWPNDVLLDGRKIAGILVEGRPQEDWAVVGIGLNVAETEFPPELQGLAGTLGLGAEAVEPTLALVLEFLDRWLAASAEEVLEAVRARDALRGHTVKWGQGQGEAAGLDGDGRLVVLTSDGRVTLEAGEVHLARE